MADQGRWFKLWCSAPSDDSLQQLTPSHRWAWAVLGCHIKVHGEHGRAIISESNAALAGQMGVTVGDLIHVIESFPNVTLEKCKNRHGEFAVTWNKWVKYQEDTTQADRARASRSKKRREEKRGDEKKKSPSSLPTLPVGGNWSDEYREFGSHYPAHRFEDTPTARRELKKARSGTSLGDIIAALERDKASADWLREEGKYVPHPTKWLRRARWRMLPGATRAAKEWEPPQVRGARGETDGLAGWFNPKKETQ